MTRELEIQFLETTISTTLKRLEELFDKISAPIKEDSPAMMNLEEFFLNWEKEEFEVKSERILNSCRLYLELKGATVYLTDFNREVRLLKEKSENLYGLTTVNLDLKDESIFLNTLKNFLFPFRAFGSGDEKILTGLDYLVSILQSTNFILNERKIIPKKESDVYNGVKLILESTFPEKRAQYLGGNEPFYKEATYYKPDILVPLLNCAIEYKFIKSRTRLTRTIDEILIDVHGYSKHPIYKWFYAVFYVKSGITTKVAFENIWKDKNFPDNWFPIFVEGPTA